MHARPAVALSLLMLSAVAAAQPPRVLVFTRTEGFRHDSIEAGVAMLQAMGALHGWTVESTDRADVFTPAGLADVRAVVWLNTTGDVLDTAQEQVFSHWVESGGGYLGIHAAADCEYGWPWYGALLGNGAWFESHPSPQAATVHRETATHPSTAHLPASFSLHEEWYNFRGNPRGAATVLLSLDEASYSPGHGAMQDHPISWYRTQGRGRVWYTGMGHASETYADTRFIGHVAGGLQWILAGPAPALYANGFEP